jgi:thiosulfate/3-mercaptopyruvate sulfurtransferase
MSIQLAWNHYGLYTSRSSVDTQWVEDHLKDSKVRVAEVDYDREANYMLRHVPGAVLFDWRKDINDPITRNILSREACEKLLQKAGVNNDTVLVLYGDFNNWFAAFAFGSSSIMDLKMSE